MEIDDEYIIHKYIDTLERVQMQHISRASAEELNYIHNRFDDSESEVETIQRIYRGIEHRPSCIYCGKPCRPKNSKCTEFYLTCNCAECKNKEAYEKYKNTFAKNHNRLTNTFQLPEVVAKIQEKRKLKQQEITAKILQTKLDRYGDSSYNNMEKSRETCEIKYGVEYSFQSENNKAKSRETCKRKYGVEYYSQTPEHLEKRRKTNLERYGCEEVVKIKAIHQKQEFSRRSKRNGEYITKEEIIAMNEVKRKRGTLNTSKPENNVYENLKTKYPNVKRNYKTELYPFMCDFYIPETDTYIECNFHWTHCGHWYNEQSEEDQQRLMCMKNKNTKFYNNAIDVWTKRDPLKLQTVIDNHLNYLVFWNENEFNEWFKNQQ